MVRIEPVSYHLLKILWPRNKRCEARADLVQTAVGSSQTVFCEKAFLVLTDPVPSTNFYNGNNNTQSIVRV